MPLRAHRVDANQRAIVEALRDVGCRVAVTSMVGGGFPDLVVYRPGHALILMEVKDGTKSASRRMLTPHEVAFHRLWEGTTYIVKTVHEAIAAVGGRAYE